MPYRHDLDLEGQRATLAAALAELREEPRTAAREDREAEVQRRIRALDLPRARRALPALPLLPRLRIASPCTESWDAMVGSDRVRHCSKCDKDVFDLSAMTTAEVAALLRAHDAMGEGLPCVRFYRRADGTILTSDCVAGRARRVGPTLAAATAVASAIALTASLTPDPPPPEIGHTGSVLDRMEPGLRRSGPPPQLEGLDVAQLAFGEPAFEEDPHVARTLLGRGLDDDAIEEEGPSGVDPSAR